MAKIKSIETLKRFGVFKDYTKPAVTHDFTDKNIIYGWNYSGKTTISRLFQILQSEQLPKHYENASFSIKLDDGSTVSESNFISFNPDAYVFNAEFVESNLRWDGEAFTPILLLGEESIEAKAKITSNEALIERCRNGYRNKQQAKTQLDSQIAEGKKEAAKEIRRVLSLVETYTAAHINQRLPIIETDPKSFLLDKAKYSEALEQATATDNDRLLALQPIVLNPSVNNAFTGLDVLLAKIPELTNTIEKLKEDANLADWVETGLVLHENKGKCEFCGNDLAVTRLDELRGHFSKDMAIFKASLESTLAKLEKLSIQFSTKDKRDFYFQFQSRLTEIQGKLTKAISDHNQAIEALATSVRSKLRDPFKQVELPVFDSNFDQGVEVLCDELNSLIDENNGVTNNFDSDKENAISKVKDHLIAEFYIKKKLANMKVLIEIHQRHLGVFESIGKRLKQENEQLEAEISHAQKGREELNGYIGKFLSGSNIEIEVIHVNGNERFQLVRNGKKAMHLSEGEKTAIAFSFFLTKLQESGDLSGLTVFIDDPISSLDSNHLFQVNAVIKGLFFFQDENEAWQTTVKQLFFSTHNFEFFGLLKELPQNKNRPIQYYLVRRTSEDSSELVNMPDSMHRYASEYQYLWEVIFDFYQSENKDHLPTLLALPNAVRRFLELYTYSKIPSMSNATVDQRAEKLFGAEKSKRLLKVLHYFSHSNNLNRLARNSDLMCDIENVVNDIVECVKNDTLHYDALMEWYGRT